jgi:hypothetical protein
MPYREYKDFEYAPMKLYDEEINNPYNVIGDFFQAGSLKEYRKYISSMLKAAHADYYWTKDDPATLLDFHQNMERLIEAVFVINSNPANRQNNKSILTDQDALKRETIDPLLYGGGNARLTNRDYFPRYLSQKEVINPYCVFDKLFKYHNLPAWRYKLYELLYYALISDGTDAAGVEMDYLTIYILLQKLVESAHLIAIREINKFKFSTPEPTAAKSNNADSRN